jgi:hypothetical protein
MIGIGQHVRRRMEERRIPQVPGEQVPRHPRDDVGNEERVAIPAGDPACRVDEDRPPERQGRNAQHADGW